MLGEGLDATRAAYRVGYQDVSHFNREYKSLVGLPPIRDMERLRARSLFFDDPEGNTIELIAHTPGGP